MPAGLLRSTNRYPLSQVDTKQKRDLVWKNIKDALGVEEARTEPFGVVVDIQDSLFDGSVQVTFSAYVTKRRG